MGWLSARYPNRIGKIASRSKPRTKSAPAIRANEKTGATYHSGQSEQLGGANSGRGCE